MAMDYVFKLTDSTSGTVTLTSSPYAYYSGGVATAAREGRTASDTLTLRLQDGAGTANLDEVRTLNRLLAQAEDAQRNPTISKVYLTWQDWGSADVWRSEIVKGRAEPRGDALTYGYWSNDTAFANVYLERLNYWEGPEVQIPLTNPNGTANTSGLTVYNCNDGIGTARYNYVDAAGTSILGDLPAAARLEMTNTHGTLDISSVYVGINHTNPDTFVQMWEGESASGISGTAYADASGTAYGPATLASGSWAAMYTWAVSAEQTAAAAGQWVHAVARFAVAGDETSTKFMIQWADGAAYAWSSPQSQPSSDVAIAIRDLITFRMPPTIPGMGSFRGGDLKLMGLQQSGSNYTINLDFLALMPADGWRHYASNGLVEDGSRIVDDAINGWLYVDDGTDDRTPALVAYGSPLALKPNKKHRFYFLWNTNVSNTAPVDLTMSIKLHYRPRRLSL